MAHNRGRAPVPEPVVEGLVSTTTARLVARHPSLGVAVVDAVVYQAATELVSTVADADKLRRLLDRRAHARLMAMTGTPIAVTTQVPAPTGWAAAKLP